MTHWSRYGHTILGKLPRDLLHGTGFHTTILHRTTVHTTDNKCIHTTDNMIYTHNGLELTLRVTQQCLLSTVYPITSYIIYAQPSGKHLIGKSVNRSPYLPFSLVKSSWLTKTWTVMGCTSQNWWIMRRGRCCKVWASRHLTVRKVRQYRRPTIKHVLPCLLTSRWSELSRYNPSTV